ncbi:MAG: DUF2911 domain-containing protein [Gemmatimonadales bacterium]|jgi:hypothetical protein|nr:MAG: DUF2911 domain-containing protein [Gemmatimonadales bacterium]
MIGRSILPAVLTLALVLVSCGDGSDGCWTTDTPGQLANRPSPLDSAIVILGEEQVRVCYGRPSARERPVMDGLVRFGEIWRLGANEATSIEVPFRSRIGDVTVDPGRYSLYVVPGAESWDVTVNGMVERWGIPVDAAVRAADIGTFSVPVEGLSQHVETLTMTFQETGSDSADLVVDWELTRIRIPVHRLEG